MHSFSHSRYSSFVPSPGVDSHSLYSPVSYPYSAANHTQTNVNSHAAPYPSAASVSVPVPVPSHASNPYYSSPSGPNYLSGSVASSFSPPAVRLYRSRADRSTSDADPSAFQMRVFARIRPFNDDIDFPRHSAPPIRPVCLEATSANSLNVYLDSSTNSASRSSAVHSSPDVVRSFQFDRVFRPDDSQQIVFDEIQFRIFIDKAFQGFAVNLLAYGMTGSGKTHTLFGSLSGPSVGIMGRSISYIFSKIPSKSSSSFLVRASYLEIYNETLRDLLNPRSGQPLNLRQNANGSFHVENSVSVVCSDESDLHSVLREGVSNRQVRAHALNQESSRSHAILIVEIEDLIAGTKGKICFCDLAGSEALKHSKSAGDALKETAHINKSLFNLGAVISALYEISVGKKPLHYHVPHRDSLLTKLLYDSLSGSGMSLMIACLSPSRLFLNESLRTLYYADRARNISSKPVQHLETPENIIFQLRREVTQLKIENQLLRQMLVKMGVNVGEYLRRAGVANANGAESAAPQSGQAQLIRELNEKTEKLEQAERALAAQQSALDASPSASELKRLSKRLHQSELVIGGLQKKLSATEAALADARHRAEKSERRKAENRALRAELAAMQNSLSHISAQSAAQEKRMEQNEGEKRKLENALRIATAQAQQQAQAVFDAFQSASRVDHQSGSGASVEALQAENFRLTERVESLLNENKELQLQIARLNGNIPYPHPPTESEYDSPNKKKYQNELFSLRRSNARLQKELQGLKLKAKLQEEKNQSLQINLSQDGAANGELLSPLSPIHLPSLPMSPTNF